MIDFHLLNHIRNNDDYIVIWLFNIGLEKYWNGEVFTVRNTKEDVLVNHLEEINLLITKKQDIFLLRNMPSEVYLKSMEEFGVEIPCIMCPLCEDENKGISELVLEDENLIIEIKKKIKSEKKVIFVPYGVSELEEQIRDRLGVPMLGAPSAINKKINNKVFSRKFAIEQGFRVADGRVCEGVEELESVSYEMLKKYGKIIIKEPCGASGKGLWVVDSEDKCRSSLMIIKRFFKNRIAGEWVIEEWCNKKADLNYQIYIGLNGETEVFSIKEQKVNSTVYIGSVMPPTFSDSIMQECKKCGEIIAAGLFELGYRGIIGVDAMILENNKLIPIVEINGRFTLSTYVSFVQEMKRATNNILFSFYNKIPLMVYNDYNGLKKQLQKKEFWYKDNSGLFVYNSESITKSRVGDNGRMFAILFAHTEDELMKQYETIIKELNTK